LANTFNSQSTTFNHPTVTFNQGGVEGEWSAYLDISTGALAGAWSDPLDYFMPTAGDWSSAENVETGSLAGAWSTVEDVETGVLGGAWSDAEDVLTAALAGDWGSTDVYLPIAGAWSTSENVETGPLEGAWSDVENVETDPLAGDWSLASNIDTPFVSGAWSIEFTVTPRERRTAKPPLGRSFQRSLVRREVDPITESALYAKHLRERTADPYRQGAHSIRLTLWRHPQGREQSREPWQVAEVIEAEYSHDVAILRTRWSKRRRREFRRLYPVGMPVVLEWGRAGRGHKPLYGYIHSRDFDEDSEGFYASLTLIGASIRMRNERGKVWRKWRLDEVMREVARTSRFNFRVAQTEYEERSISQRADELPWAFLSRYAMQHGLTTYFEGSRLELRAVKRDIETMKKTFPTRSFVDDEIYSFEHREGSALPGEVDVSRRTAIALNPRTGQVQVLEGDKREPNRFNPYPAMTSRVMTGIAPENLDELRRSLQQTEDRASRNTVHATAVVRGDARMVPASAVYLKGVSERDDGYWLVSGVTHRVTSSGFVCVLDIERPERAPSDPEPDPPGPRMWQTPREPDEDAPRLTQADRRRRPVIDWTGSMFGEINEEDYDTFPPQYATPIVTDVDEREAAIIRRRSTEEPLLYGEWRARVVTGIGAGV